MSDWKLVPVEPTDEMVRAGYHARFEQASTNRIYRAMLAAAPAVSAEPVLVVEKEPDYWSRGHFYEGTKPHIDPTKVWDLPIGTKLYLHPPAPAVAWQPIETAPKDREIWLWFPTMLRGHMTVGRWEDDRYAKKPKPYWAGSVRGRVNEYRDNPPTLWQPLPTQPNGGAE